MIYHFCRLYYFMIFYILLNDNIKNYQTTNHNNMINNYIYFYAIVIHLMTSEIAKPVSL